MSEIKDKPNQERDKLLLLVFLGALALRLIYVLTLKDRAYWPDEIEYHGIAVNLLKGLGYSYYRDYGSSVLGPTAYRMPGLPFFLFLIYHITGPHFVTARIFQAVISTSLVPISYAITQELYLDKRAAIIASILAAIYPYYIFLAGALYPVMLTALCSSLSILFLLKGSKRQDFRFELFAGIMLGAGILTFGHLGGAIPFLVIWILQNKKTDTPRRWQAAIVLMLVSVVIFTPWVIRNRMTLGYTGLSTAFPYNLYVANRPESKWDCGSLSMNMEPPEVKQQAAKMREGETTIFYMKLAKEEIAANPGHYVIVSLGRAAYFWRPYPKPAARQVKMVEKLVGLMTYLPVFLVSVIWLFTEGKRRKLDLILIYGPMAAMLIAALSVSVDRYRLPFDLNLIILASIAVTTWYERAKTKA